MKNIHFCYLFCALMLICSCGGNSNTGKQTLTRKLAAPVVPGVITDNAEASVYLSAHWWDSLSDTTSAYLSDTSHINGVSRAEIEQAMANYTMLLASVPLAEADKSVKRFCANLEKMEKHNPADSSLERMSDIYEHYLYDPNSPMRNEEFYLSFCRYMAESEFVEASKRGVYAYQAQMCSLNRLGTPAADFEFSDKNGKIRSLYSVKAVNTLLFFSNPDCHACKSIIDNLLSINGMDAMIASGRLAIVNIYIDEDLSAWYNYMPVYPDNWYNGYDHNMMIRNDMLYNVRAIPSLYLLDENKNVIMKDAPENNILNYLYSLTN